MVKNPPANVGDADLNPGSGGPSEKKKWQPIPVFLPGKSHGRRAWWPTVHGVTKETDNA